ncbi:hypothetical protein DP116_00280 [Brasilonema bromeliae SPC951]|uniref:Uncharacterized protein n=1 Tax=Brasilonema bromeliae SPC951 TaxID=385972 RepID=A0ABX1P229_9CYAN|nr:hypothetical protein [Brasilonema bromeliae SPC951]
MITFIKTVPKEHRPLGRFLCEDGVLRLFCLSTFGRCFLDVPSPQIENLGREIGQRIVLGKQGRLPFGQTLLGVSPANTHLTARAKLSRIAKNMPVQFLKVDA